MIALKVEKIGDRIAVVLTEEALAALHLSVGDTLQLEPSGEGSFNAVGREGWADDPHARGRAFLRRYNKTFERFEG
jgi:antitoxin component of MazEF toxin-antitoxin module